MKFKNGGRHANRPTYFGRGARHSTPVRANGLARLQPRPQRTALLPAHADQRQECFEAESGVDIRLGEEGGLETTPIIVGRVLYAYTPSQKVIALDAATGRLIWKFDSGIAGTAPARGLAYWTEGSDGRIFAGVMNYLYALDVRTGQPIASFGENGRVDLRKGLGRDFESQSIALTTPGLIYKDLIVVGVQEL